MEYFARDVERITGVQRLRLHHWLKEGFIKPSVQVARGIGDKNIYSRDDIYKIALLKKLIENGMHGKTAASSLLINENIYALYQSEKSQGRPGLILCVTRRIENGEASTAKVWLDLPDVRHQPGSSFGDKIMSSFANQGCDDAIIINLSKLIDEVELKM